MKNEPTTLETTLTTISATVDRLTVEARALRCLQWADAWANGRHAEAPTRPDYVRAFEARFGALPGSAEGILRGASVSSRPSGRGVGVPEVRA